MPIPTRDILRTVRAETGLLLDFCQGQRGEFAGSINRVLNALALVDGMGYCQVSVQSLSSCARCALVAVSKQVAMSQQTLPQPMIEQFTVAEGVLFWLRARVSPCGIYCSAISSVEPVARVIGLRAEVE